MCSASPCRCAQVRLGQSMWPRRLAFLSRRRECPLGKGWAVGRVLRPLLPPLAQAHDMAAAVSLALVPLSCPLQTSSPYSGSAYTYQVCAQVGGRAAAAPSAQARGGTLPPKQHSSQAAACLQVSPEGRRTSERSSPLCMPRAFHTCPPHPPHPSSLCPASPSSPPTAPPTCSGMPAPSTPRRSPPSAGGSLGRRGRCQASPRCRCCLAPPPPTSRQGVPVLRLHGRLVCEEAGGVLPPSGQLCTVPALRCIAQHCSRTFQPGSSPLVPAPPSPCLQAGASNILFSNGLLDPWSSGGWHCAGATN